MHERPTQGAEHGASSRPAAGLENSFLSGPPRSPAAPAVGQPAAAPPGPAAKSWLRVAVPVGLFMVLVAGIAWVTQFLPDWRARKEGPPPAPVKPIRLLDSNTAQWDTYEIPPPKKESGRDSIPKKRFHLGEFEHESEGHYVYAFESALDTDLAIGLQSKSCRCSRLEVCLITGEELTAFTERVEEGKKLIMAGKQPKQSAQELEPPAQRWKTLELNDTDGIHIPPHRPGLIRLTWKGNTKDEDGMVLHARLWLKPAQGKVEELKLDVPIALVPPVRVYPPKEHVSFQSSGQFAQREFFFWSATRDDLDVQPVGEPDPCVKVEVRKVRPEKLKKLEMTLLGQGDIVTRPRSACQVVVTVYEERNGKQLDMGAVVRAVPVRVTAGGEEIKDPPTPIITGRVRGVVTVDGADDLGRIDLKDFDVTDDTIAKVHLVADAAVDLADRTPAQKHLTATLGKKQVADGEATWELEVRVPRKTFPRARELPPGTAVILEATAPGRPRRLLRIPVIGTSRATSS
jgi:hypothetical protein